MIMDIGRFQCVLMILVKSVTKFLQIVMEILHFLYYTKDSFWQSAEMPASADNLPDAA